MKHLITSLAVTVALSATPAFAASSEKDDSTKNELIGLGSGAVIGAVIAGPAGAAVAGLFGLMIADDVNDENKLEQANERLAMQQNSIDAQRSVVAALRQELEQNKQQAELQLVSMDKEIERVTMDTESSIQFRTGSAQIEGLYQSQLDLIAENLTKNPQLTVSLSGYADRRGDDAFNQSLSEQRVENVKAYLVSKGAEAKQVMTYAYGEANPVSEEHSLENDFFDRRVHINLIGDTQILTAAK